MIGVLGQCKKSTIVYFDIQGRDRVQREEPKPLVVNGMHTLFGYFVPYENSRAEDVVIEYSDLVNKCFITIHRDLSCPKTKIYVNLAPAHEYAVPQFFMVGHFRIVDVRILSTKRVYKGEDINKQLVLGKKVNLWTKVFFENIGEPLVTKVVKESPIGEIHSIKKKLKGIEL